MRSLIQQLLPFWGLSAIKDVDVTSAANELIDVTAPLPNYGPVVAENTLINGTFGSLTEPISVAIELPEANFTHVTLSLELNSTGIADNSLTRITFDDVEVWRLFLPSSDDQPICLKSRADVSEFAPLFSYAQSLKVLSDSVSTKQLEGDISIKLSAEYFYSPNNIEESFYDGAPSRVEALSSDSKDSPIAVPKLSRSTVRAVINIFISGIKGEENWYQSDSPTRFVSVLLNGEPAGDFTPYPSVNPGTFEPHLWSPIVPIRSFNQPHYAIDVTPFLPALWKSPLPLNIVVNGADGDWVISASLLTWEDPNLEGTGLSYPAVVTEKPFKLQLPGVEIVSNTRDLNASADLTFTNNSTKKVEKLRVEWLQHTKLHDVQTQRKLKDVNAFSVSGGSGLNVNGDALHTEEYEYSFVSTMSAGEISVSEGYKLEFPLSSIEVGQNASWGPDAKVNGTDVYVKEKSPDYKAHVIARDGKLLPSTYMEVDFDSEILDIISSELIEAVVHK